MSRYKCQKCRDTGNVCARCGESEGVCDCEGDGFGPCPECNLESIDDDDFDEIADDCDEGDDIWDEAAYWEDDQP